MTLYLITQEPLGGVLTYHHLRILSLQLPSRIRLSTSPVRWLLRPLREQQPALNISIQVASLVERTGKIAYIHHGLTSNTLAIPSKAELPFILIVVVHPVRVDTDVECIFNHVCTVSKPGAREVIKGQGRCQAST